MSFDHLNFEIGDNLSGMTSENKSTVPSIVIDASLTSDLLQNNLSETSNQSIASTSNQSMTSNNSGMHSSFYVSTGLSNGGNYTGSAITPLSSLSSNSVITPFKPDAPPDSPNPTLQQTMFPVPNSQAYVKGDLDQNEAAASNSSDDSSVVFISQTAASNSSDESSDESSVVFISPTSASNSSREQANQQVDSDSTYLPSESGTSVTDDHHHQKRPRK